MITSQELNALSMQDWLLRRAGYHPSQVKDIDLCSEQFYAARWRNKDISRYWHRMCKQAPCNASGMYISDSEGVIAAPKEDTAPCQPSPNI